MQQACAPDLTAADPHRALQQVITPAQGILGGIEEQGEPGPLVGTQAVFPQPGGDHSEQALYGHCHGGGCPLPRQR